MQLGKTTSAENDNYKQFSGSPGFGNSNAGKEIGDGRFQNASKKTKLLIRTIIDVIQTVGVIDVIQTVVMAKIEMEVRRKSVSVSNLGNFGTWKIWFSDQKPKFRYWFLFYELQIVDWGLERKGIKPVVLGRWHFENWSQMILMAVFTLFCLSIIQMRESSLPFQKWLPFYK